MCFKFASDESSETILKIGKQSKKL